MFDVHQLLELPKIYLGISWHKIPNGRNGRSMLRRFMQLDVVLNV
jgi:hypothetical protein